MTYPTMPPRPTHEEIARLEPFEGLSLDCIYQLSTPAEFEAAQRELIRERFIGFDTESKPTFTKGEISNGPHVVQFALRDRAFIAQISNAAACEFIKDILESQSIMKVGFGLKSDRSVLQHKLGAHLHSTFDLAVALHQAGFHQAVGAKAAVAIVLKRRLQKSKSISTSNWARQSLLPKQLLYAANDAYAALAVFYALGMHETACEETGAC
jgi:ribonuclease D